MYDYLIVGAGLFGSVFAYEATKKGKRCLVIDKRSHIGGNIYCEIIEDIVVHKYGAHIFHTSNKEIWDYINQFAEFNGFINSPLANYRNKIYNLPFNMNTFNTLWGVTTPESAKAIIDKQREQAGITEPKNLEEQAISLVGTDIYERLIKGYTEKQWGRKCSELPVSIINRIPVRFTYDNNYFFGIYQGIPIGGYNQIIEKMLDKCDVKLSIDFFSDIEGFKGNAKKIVYTGMIDEYFKYIFGTLQYRSLTFENEVLDIPNYQGNAVINYTSAKIPFTRIIEHKHFEFGRQEKTVITREYPKEWVCGDEPYYPITDETNSGIYEQYRYLADKEQNVIFGGRLGTYRYLDMDQVIDEALICVRKEIV